MPAPEEERPHADLSQPGAYRGAPGEELIRTDGLDYSLLPAGAESSSPMQLVRHHNSDVVPARHDSTDLVEAREVSDDEEEARVSIPVDSFTQEQKRLERKRILHRDLFGVCCFVAAAVAVVLGLWFGVLNATSALEMMDTEYQLVLIYEYFEESLVLLANLLCIPLAMVTSLNINSQGFDKVR